MQFPCIDNAIYFYFNMKHQFRRKDFQVTTAFYVNFNFIPQQFSVEKCLSLHLEKLCEQLYLKTVKEG